MAKKVPDSIVLVGAGILFLILFNVALGVRKKSASQPPRDPIAERQREQDEEFRKVKWAYWDAVRDRLKAPKSAEFDNTVVGLNKNDSTKIVTVGKVTAQNSFGANLTNDYGCEYDRVSKTLIQVSISNR